MNARVPRPLVVFACTLVTATCILGGGDNPWDTWLADLPAQGVVSGLVIEASTGAPIAGAEVALAGGATTTTGSDGAFFMPAPIGRARLTVQRDGFVLASRDVVVGPQRFDVTLAMPRRGRTAVVTQTGATLVEGQASLDVPAGALPDGTQVALTFLPAARVGAASAPPQFVDEARTPRRVQAVAVVEVGGSPAMPVRLQAPVPEAATVDAVAAYLAGPTGTWTEPVPAQSVSGGVATFALTRAGQYGVAVRADVAGGLGYVVDQVRSARGAVASEGQAQVLRPGDEIVASVGALILVDPAGNVIELAPGTRVRVATPGQPPPEEAAEQRLRAGVTTDMHAGSVRLQSGTARVVTAPGSVETSAYRFMLRTQTTIMGVRGTAFSVSICAAGGQSFDLVEVYEGMVETQVGEGTSTMGAGKAATFCKGCQGGQAPVCQMGGGGDRAVDAGVVADAAHTPDVARDTVVDTQGMPMGMPPGEGSRCDLDGPLCSNGLLCGGGFCRRCGGDYLCPAGYTCSAGSCQVVKDGPLPDAGTATVDASTTTMPPPRARLEWKPPTHSFGAVSIGTSSAPMTLTLSNTGGQPASGLAIQVSSRGPAEFPIMNRCADTLPAGESCTVEVRFSPTTTGSKLASIVATERLERAAASVSGSGSPPPVDGGTAALILPNP